MGSTISAEEFVLCNITLNLETVRGQFNIFAASLHLQTISAMRNLKASYAVVTREPLTRI
jgi:hypothetical protein